MGQLNGGQFVASLFEMVSETFVLEILSAEAPLRNDLRNTVDAGYKNTLGSSNIGSYNRHK